MNRSADPIAPRTPAHDCHRGDARARPRPRFSRRTRIAEVAALRRRAERDRGADARSARSLLWCSIDNDDSRDLDQLSVAEPLANGDVKLLVAIADVDAAVRQGLAGRSARGAEHDVGLHAGGHLSDAAGAAVDRPHVAERARGSPRGRHRVRRLGGRRARRRSDVYGAVVRNQAKLAYNAVGAWLDGDGSAAAGGRGGAGHGRAAADAGPGGAGARAAAARSTARSTSRPSRSSPSSTATRCATCGRRRRTARRR